MPAPNDPLRAPYPNLVIPGWPRVAVHIVTVTGANGSAALNASKSSQAVGVAYVSEGRYTITFPAGGTGAVGFMVAGIGEIADPTTVTAGTSIQAADSDLVNYATGTAVVQSYNNDATPAVQDIIGDFSVMVFVLLGPGGAV